jgi:SAM-dependent methyltransferase
MQQAAWFESWFNSSYYHRLYQDRDESEAQAFIEQLTDHLRLSPGARILDLACGKGRHSLSLADLGYEVLGIDIAPQSIAYAQQFERPGLRFMVHDMREKVQAPGFDVVLNLFTSFGYFDSATEQQRALHTMATALNESGTLVIDYLNVAYVSSRLIRQEQRSIQEDHYSIERWEDADHFYKAIEVLSPNEPTPLRFQEKVAKFSLSDFQRMLAQEGLRIRETFGNYQLQPYHPEDSPRLILVAERNQ